MKKKITHYAAWFICLVLGIVCGVQLFIWGGRPAILIVFGLSLVMVVVLEWCLGSSDSGSNTEDVEALKKKLAEKTKLVDDQAKAIKSLCGDRDGYHKNYEEACRREALLKKQVRELRGRAEYWRTKYKSVAPEFVDAADEEIIITQNTDAQC